MAFPELNQNNVIGVHGRLGYSSRDFLRKSELFSPMLNHCIANRTVCWSLISRLKYQGLLVSYSAKSRQHIAFWYQWHTWKISLKNSALKRVKSLIDMPLSHENLKMTSSNDGEVKNHDARNTWPTIHALSTVINSNVTALVLPCWYTHMTNNTCIVNSNQ